MKRAIAFILLAALLGLIIYFVIKTNQFIKQARTYGTFGLAMVAMDKTLSLEAWNKGYDVASETQSMFPGVNASQGVILDAWGNPIHVEIRRLAKSFSIHIVSAGIDGKFGTPDDCVRDLELADEPASKR